VKETGTSVRRPLGLTLELRDPEWRDLGAWLDEAEALGLDFAELPLAELPLIVGGRVRRDRVAAVRALCAGRALAYTLHGTLGINLMEERFRIGLHLDVLKANIEIAAELGCAHLVIHAGFTPEAQAAAIEDAYARQRAHLAAMGDVAAAHGVTLCVENIFEFAGRRHTALPGRLARELAAVGHAHVAATFDLSHGWLHCAQRGADFLAEAEALAPFARHLHLHDSFGRPDDFWTCTPVEALAFGIGDLHLPMGWGSVPWDAIAARCVFPPGVMADLEIEPRHRAAHAETVAFARGWLGGLGVG
jgi:sugar phosphate isomerase/epimerase